MGSYDDWKTRLPASETEDYRPTGTTRDAIGRMRGALPDEQPEHDICGCDVYDCANHPGKECSAEIDASNSERVYLVTCTIPDCPGYDFGVVMCTPCADDAMASGEWQRQPRRPERDN